MTNIVSEYRGKINVIDLYDKPLNLVHEFFYNTFLIQEAKLAQRKAEEEKARAEKEAEEKRNAKQNSKPIQFSNRLSPAAQAQESQQIKAQSDDKSKSEENSYTNSEPILPSNLDLEDIAEALEEGV